MLGKYFSIVKGTIKNKDLHFLEAFAPNLHRKVEAAR